MGSKATNLQELLKAGFNVPILEVLPCEGVTDESIKHLAEEKFPSVEFFAVRSSALVEDGENKSFAGYFHSEVGVAKEGLYKAWQNVVASYNGQLGDVIVQQFVPSEKAGVLFTNEGNNLMVINSCQGLCKTVVEGNACDEWYAARDGKMLSKHIAENKKPLIFDGSKVIHVNETSDDSLTLDEVSLLVKEGLKIEELFGSPQDIEWCFYQNKLYILQSRPITRFNNQRNWIFYDSANIAESYSGVVLPLTHSFAVSIYKKVYENLLMASGTSKRRIARNQHIFSNMVNNFYGRMYYNMNNWYLMMSFLPGYDRNKGNLEEMLTMNIREEIPRSVLPSIWLKIGYPFIALGKTIFFKSTFNRFVHKVKSTLHRYRKEPIEAYSANQCVDLYRMLDETLLEKFHIPVENDFLMMTFLGILRKKHNDEDLKKLIAFDNISSRQVERIAGLAKVIFDVPELVDAIEKQEMDVFKEKLSMNSVAHKAFNDYFELYGGRFANELKLESSDIEFEMDAFVNMLKAYRNFSKPAQKEERLEVNGFVVKQFVKYASQREEMRLLRSNCFSLVRRIFRRLGQLFADRGVIAEANDVFYLSMEEVLTLATNDSVVDLKQKVTQIKLEYERFKGLNPPSFFTVPEGGEPLMNKTESVNESELKGRSCTPGIVSGIVRVFHEFSVPDTIDFDIMVTRNTDPGWTALIGLSKGIIVENGGILSHAAIVSRELGIPTVIGVANVTQRLKTGQRVELNGATGEIKILK